MTRMAPEASRITVGELGRRMEAFEKRIEERFVGLHRRLDEMKFVPAEVFAEYRVAEDRRLADLEADNKALAARIEAQDRQRAADRRLIWTSLVAPVLVAIAVAVILATTIGGT